MAAGRPLVPAAIGVAVGVLLVGLGLPSLIEAETASVPVDDSATVARATADGRVTPPGEVSSQGAAPVEGGQPGSPGAADGAPSRSPPPGEASGAARPDDTSQPLTLGFVLFDIGAVSRVGVSVPNFSPEEQRAVYQVFVDDLNERGGVQGRRVEAVYSTYNVLDTNDMRASCLELTEDHHVFAVLDPTGAFYGPPVLCVTEEHQTPFLSTGSTAFTDEMFNRSGGRLFTILQRGSRILANQAVLLAETNALTPSARIGILNDTRSGNSETVQAGLIDTLEQLGREVAVRAQLAPDNATSASQMPVFVQQMRQANVDAVFLAVGTLNAAQFVQSAENQMYRPRYYSSDWFAGSGDNWAQNMPASFDGNVAVTATRTGEWRVNQPEPAKEASCRTVYETRTKTRIPRGETTYGLATNACNLLGLLEAGAASSSPMTVESFTAGVARLGRVQLANVAAASFQPSKHDAADEIRMLRWEAGCKCWKPSSQFRPSRF